MAENSENKRSELVPVMAVQRSLTWDQAPRLSAVLEEIAPQGASVKIRDFVGQEIMVLSVEPFKGQYGVALYVIFADENGVLYNTIVGQKLLGQKLYTVMDDLPLKAKVVEVQGGAYGRYFDFE